MKNITKRREIFQIENTPSPHNYNSYNTCKKILQLDLINLIKRITIYSKQNVNKHYQSSSIKNKNKKKKRQKTYPKLFKN